MAKTRARWQLHKICIAAGAESKPFPVFLIDKVLVSTGTHIEGEHLVHTH